MDEVDLLKVFKILGWVLWFCLTIGLYSIAWETLGSIIFTFDWPSWSFWTWAAFICFVIGATVLYALMMLSFCWLVKRYVKLEKVTQ